MSFDFLYHPIESLDESLTGLFEGAPLLVALGLAFLLGLATRVGPRSPRGGHLACRRR